LCVNRYAYGLANHGENHLPRQTCKNASGIQPARGLINGENHGDTGRPLDVYPKCPRPRDNHLHACGFKTSHAGGSRPADRIPPLRGR